MGLYIRLLQYDMMIAPMLKLVRSKTIFAKLQHGTNNPIRYGVMLVYRTVGIKYGPYHTFLIPYSVSARICRKVSKEYEDFEASLSILCKSDVVVRKNQFCDTFFRSTTYQRKKV